MIYALDTNIISFIIKGSEIVRERYFEAVSKGIHCVIPLMVYYEVKRGLKANNAENRLRSFEGICTVLGIANLTIVDMDIASDIYAQRKALGRPIDDGDLLIAAQCINNSYVLVTNNTKHFQDIKGLDIIDWIQ